MADEEHYYKGSGLPADALNEPVLGRGLAQGPPLDGGSFLAPGDS
jgi:hypothetical protein